MSSVRERSSSRAGSTVSIRRESNDSQSLLIFEGDDGASGVVSIRNDVDAAAALDLVDAIEAEVATTVPGLRLDRTPVAVRDLGAGHE